MNEEEIISPTVEATMRHTKTDDLLSLKKRKDRVRRFGSLVKSRVY